MIIRMVITALAIFLVGLSALHAKKQAHDWKPGVLLRIVPGDAQDAYIPEIGGTLKIRSRITGGAASGAAGLVIQGGDMAFVVVLQPTQKEPNIQVGKALRYAVESVHCGLTDDCGYEEKKDSFGRVTKTPVKFHDVLYLLDADGRISEFKLLAQKPFPKAKE